MNVIIRIFLIIYVIFGPKPIAALKCYTGQQNSTLLVSGSPTECEVPNARTCIKTFDPIQQLTTLGCSTTNCTIGNTTSTSAFCQKKTDYPYTIHCCCYGDGCNASPDFSSLKPQEAATYNGAPRGGPFLGDGVMINPKLWKLCPGTEEVLMKNIYSSQGEIEAVVDNFINGQPSEECKTFYFGWKANMTALVDKQLGDIEAQLKTNGSEAAQNFLQKIKALYNNKALTLMQMCQQAITAAKANGVTNDTLKELHIPPMPQNFDVNVCNRAPFAPALGKGVMIDPKLWKLCPGAQEVLNNNSYKSHGEIEAAADNFINGQPSEECKAFYYGWKANMTALVEKQFNDFETRLKSSGSEAALKLLAALKAIYENKALTMQQICQQVFYASKADGVTNDTLAELGIPPMPSNANVNMCNRVPGGPGGPGGQGSPAGGNNGSPPS